MILLIEPGKGEMFVCRSCDKKFVTDEYIMIYTNHFFNQAKTNCPICGDVITNFIKNEDYKDA